MAEEGGIVYTTHTASLKWTEHNPLKITNGANWFSIIELLCKLVKFSIELYIFLTLIEFIFHCIYHGVHEYWFNSATLFIEKSLSWWYSIHIKIIWPIIDDSIKLMRYIWDQNHSLMLLKWSWVEYIWRLWVSRYLAVLENSTENQ